MSHNVSPEEQQALLGQTAEGDKAEATDFAQTGDEAPVLGYPNGGGAHPLSRTPSPAASNIAPHERQSAVSTELQAEWETATQHLRGVSRSQAESALPTLLHSKQSTPADLPDWEFNGTSNASYGSPVTSPRDHSLQAYHSVEPRNSDFEPFFGCYWCPETGGPCDHCSRCPGCPQCFEAADGPTVQSAQSLAATAITPAALPAPGKVTLEKEYQWIEEIIGHADAEETEDHEGEWEMDIFDILEDPAIIEQERRELERLKQEWQREMLVDSDDDDSLYSLPKIQGQSQAPGAAEAGTVSSASAVSGAFAPAADITSAAVAPASSDLVSYASNTPVAALSAKGSVEVGIPQSTVEEGIDRHLCSGIEEGRGEMATGSDSIEQCDFKDDTSSSC